MKSSGGNARNITLVLPPLFDAERRQSYVVKVRLELHLPVARSLFGEQGTCECSSIGITAEGFRFDIPAARGTVAKHGAVLNWELPRFEEVVERLAIATPVEGASAIALAPAMLLTLETLPRARGQRGPGQKNQDYRDRVIAACLVNISTGMTWSKAIDDALNTCDTDAVFDANSLRQAVRRFLASS